MAVLEQDALIKILQKFGLKPTNKDPDGSKLQSNTVYYYLKGKDITLYLSQDKYSGDKKIARKNYLRSLAQKINLEAMKINQSAKKDPKKDTKMKPNQATYKDKLPGVSSSAGGIQMTEGTRISAKMFSGVGKKENRGIVFEQNLYKDFKTAIAGGTRFIYNDFMNNFMKSIAPEEIVAVQPVGARNTPRPLGADSKGVYVSVHGGGRKYDIGDAVVDILVIVQNPKTKKKRNINLSAKYGSTVTFFNSGVKKFFTEESFKTGDFSKNPVAEGLIELFGIDPKLFQGVFLNYVESEDGVKKKADKKNVSVKVDSKKMKEFIKTVIGKGYILVHEHANHSVSSYVMDDKFLEKAATLTSDTITIEYPKGGQAKRIDIRVSTEVFYLNFNIRNKQSGILPSHIMCDYKFK